MSLFEFANGAPIRVLLAVGCLVLASPALGQSFQHIRIGDIDGFGFKDTSALVRASARYTPGPADSDADGVLGENEFLPDINRDGGVAWMSGDNFDNRNFEEATNRVARCQGCLNIGRATSGSIWTDLSLSISARPNNWPDADGPQLPNNAVFVFDFTVSRDAIAEGVEIFFNLVFGDYDVDPALIGVRFADGRSRTLALQNQGPLDGLIQARTEVFSFEDIFSHDEDGNWRGFLSVVFFAPADPYTAFDYVELSLVELVLS